MARHLPTSCPSCRAELHVVGLACPGCDTHVSGDYALPALARLSAHEQEFVMSFVLSSGSLKQMAKLYRVSYPTVRNRLDELIAQLTGIAGTVASDTKEKEG